MPGGRTQSNKSGQDFFDKLKNLPDITDDREILVVMIQTLLDKSYAQRFFSC